MNLVAHIRSLFNPAIAEIAPDKSKVPDYLAAIKPFRYAVVYPLLLRSIGRRWQA